MPSNRLILYHPLILLPLTFPSNRVFSKESVLRIRWPKYWSFSFTISPSNEYSGLISFKMDWLDLLAIQGTLNSLLQHHNLKASVLHIRWQKYRSFSFSISPANEYSGLISIRIDWFDLLAIQGTLKISSVPQFAGINSSALRLLYGTALTTVRDHWEDYSLDYMDLCQQSNVSAFQHTV